MTNVTCTYFNSIMYRYDSYYSRYRSRNFSHGSVLTKVNSGLRQLILWFVATNQPVTLSRYWKLLEEIHRHNPTWVRYWFIPFITTLNNLINFPTSLSSWMTFFCHRSRRDFLHFLYKDWLVNVVKIYIYNWLLYQCFYKWPR